MYHALITRLAIRRSGWIFLIAVGLGAVTLPLAQLSIPGFDDLGDYTQHVLFSAIPLPLTVLAAVFLRRVAIDGEDCPGRRTSTLQVAQCLFAPALLLPALLIPAFSHPVSLAPGIAVAVTFLVTGVVMVATPFLQWRFAWLPAAVVAVYLISLGVPTGHAEAQLLLTPLVIAAAISYTAGVLLCCVFRSHVANSRTTPRRAEAQQALSVTSPSS